MIVLRALAQAEGNAQDQAMQAKQSLLDADAEAAEEIAAANADLASTKQSLLAAEAAATGGASKLRDELSLALKDAVTAKQSLLDAEAEAAEAITSAETATASAIVEAKAAAETATQSLLAAEAGAAEAIKAAEAEAASAKAEAKAAAETAAQSVLAAKAEAAARIIVVEGAAASAKAEAKTAGKGQVWLLANPISWFHRFHVSRRHCADGPSSWAAGRARCRGCEAAWPNSNAEGKSEMVNDMCDVVRLTTAGVVADQSKGEADRPHRSVEDVTGRRGLDRS